MIITDCHWETALNRRTCEIQVERDDLFSSVPFKGLEDTYQYIVVKVPMSMVDFNHGLAQMGYATSEVQSRISMKYEDFDFDDPRIQRICPYTDFKSITEASDVGQLLKNITPGMFSTDRITLDPHFSKEIGCERYRNWISSAFEKRQNKFLWLLYKGEKVGFSMYRDELNTTEGILGGLFTPYQSKGLGVLTATRHLLYAKKFNKDMRKYFTTISSNNQAVWKIYNRLNFQIENMQYVLVRHTDKTL